MTYVSAAPMDETMLECPHLTQRESNQFNRAHYALNLDVNVLTTMQQDEAQEYVSEVQKAFADFFANEDDDMLRLHGAQRLGVIIRDERIHAAVGPKKVGQFIQGNLSTLWDLHVQSKVTDSPYKKIFGECVTEDSCIPHVRDIDLYKVGYLSPMNKSGEALEDQLCVLQRFLSEKNEVTKAHFTTMLMVYADDCKDALVANLQDVTLFDETRWDDYRRLATCIQTLKKS